MALLQEIHDSAIGGTISWNFDSAFVGELGWIGGFTAYGRAESAAALAEWMAATAAKTNNSSNFVPEPLAAIQNLHDLEINGTITWWKPDVGFHVELYGLAIGEFATWGDAEKWLRSQALGGATDSEDMS
jgi:hypothetical protein